MFPFPIKPMLLQTTEKPFSSPDHIFELKVDGIRCIMFFNEGQVRLQSKTGKDCTNAFPELWTPSIQAKEVIVDGEITVLTGGKPDFEAVMERYMAGSKNINTLVHKKPAVYFIWDILWHNDKPLINLPLLERKQLLDEVLENNTSINKIYWVDTDGLVLWEAVKDQGLEGMVAKKKKSIYEFRRSSSWLKIKNYQEEIVNVFGYAKKDGAVLVGTGDNIQGHATGIRGTEKAALWELLEQLGTAKGNKILLPPGIRGKVKFTTWTNKGNMRDCSWVSFALE